MGVVPLIRVGRRLCQVVVYTRVQHVVPFQLRGLFRLLASFPTGASTLPIYPSGQDPIQSHGRRFRVFSGLRPSLVNYGCRVFSFLLYHRFYHGHLISVGNLEVVFLYSMERGGVSGVVPCNFRRRFLLFVLRAGLVSVLSRKRGFSYYARYFPFPLLYFLHYYVQFLVNGVI